MIYLRRRRGRFGTKKSLATPYLNEDLNIRNEQGKRIEVGRGIKMDSLLGLNCNLPEKILQAKVKCQLLIYSILKNKFPAYFGKYCCSF